MNVIAKLKRVILPTVVTLVTMSFNVHADTITFAPGDYDNTANTVTGTNASPVLTNNQTTGEFRDVFWWGAAYNGGTSGVGSPDFINSGSNLISNGGSPSRAVLGGNDTALNFTGQRTSGGQSFLTIYDKTPGDGTATKNTFDASILGGITISTDVLFTPGNHAVSAGIVSAYNEGQDGLALLAFNGAGNNADAARLSLVFNAHGVTTLLASTPLAASSFVGDTDGSNALLGDHWYRIIMNLTTVGDAYTVNGSFFGHSDPMDPNSALGTSITSLVSTGFLSGPGNALDLTNPGEIGLMAATSESFSDGLGNGGTGANPLTDNIGVSFTNFQTPNNPVPEPGTMMLLGVGFLGLAVYGKRRKNA